MAGFFNQGTPQGFTGFGGQGASNSSGIGGLFGQAQKPTGFAGFVSGFQQNAASSTGTSFFGQQPQNQNKPQTQGGFGQSSFNSNQQSGFNKPQSKQAKDNQFQKPQLNIQQKTSQFQNPGNNQMQSNFQQSNMQQKQGLKAKGVNNFQQQQQTNTLQQNSRGGFSQTNTSARGSVRGGKDSFRGKGRGGSLSQPHSQQHQKPNIDQPKTFHQSQSQKKVPAFLQNSNVKPSNSQTSITNTSQGSNKQTLNITKKNIQDKQQLEIPKQISLHNTLNITKPKPQANSQPTPSGKPQVEEEYDNEDEQEEYYDDEYYDEEEEEEEEQKKDQQEAIGSNSQNTNQAGQKICQYYQQGNCKFGDQCQHLHTKGAISKQKDHQQKDICQHFLNGNCKFGDSCKNSHDPQVIQEQLTAAAKQMGVDLQNPQLQQIMQPAKKPNLFQKDLEETKASSQYVEMDDYDEEVEDPQPTEEEQAERAETLKQFALKNKGKDLRALVLNNNNSSISTIQPQNFSQDKQQPIVKPQIQPAKKVLGGKTLGQKGSVPEKLINQASKEIISMPKPQSKPQLKAFEDVKEEEILFPTQIDSEWINQRRSEIFKKIAHLQLNKQDYIIPGRAELLQLCSAEEIYQRGSVEVGAASNFELDNNGENFEKLAVKSYNRSAADKVMNEPHVIRPPEMLYLVTSYLRDCIVDQDALEPFKSSYKINDQTTGKQQFRELYSFVRDRGRTIAQDIIVLNEATNIYVIKCLEELTRFTILVFYDGYFSPNFDSYMNMKLVTQNLGALRSYYAQVKQKYQQGSQERAQLLANEAEFQSYLIICSASDLIMAQQQLSESDLDEADVQGQMLLKQALTILSSIINSDFFRFMKLIKRTNYMFACIMIHYLSQLRCSGIQSICRSEPDYISILSVKKKLMFSSVDETLNFLEDNGYNNFKDDKFFKEREKVELKTKWKAQGKLQFMEIIKGGKLRRDYMKDGVNVIQSKEALEKLQKQRQDALNQMQLQKQQLLLAKQEMERQAQIEKINKDNEEKRQQELIEQQKRELEEKQKIEAERIQKEIDEQIRIEKEKIEQERQKKIALKNKLNSIKIFVIAKQAKHKIRRCLKDWRTQAKIQKHVKKSYIRKWKKISEQIAKEERKEFLRSHKVQLQLEELSQANSFAPLPNRAQILQSFSNEHINIQQSQRFKISQLIASSVNQQEGVIRIKFIGGQMFNQEQLKSNEEKFKQQIDVQSSLISLFTDSQKSLSSTSNDQGEIVYEAELKKDKLKYQFIYSEIDDFSEVSLTGTSLLVYLTRGETFPSDIKQLHHKIGQYCPYSKINILLLFYTNDNSIDKDDVQQKLDVCFNDLQEKMTIESLQISYIMMHVPLKTQLQKLNFNDKSLESIIQVQIQETLKDQLEIIKATRNDLQTTSYKLVDVLKYCLIDLDDVIKLCTHQPASNFQKTFKNFLSYVKQQNEDISIDVTLDNEIQVLNFWLMILKKMLMPLQDSLGQASQFLLLNSNVEEEYEEQTLGLKIAHEFINNVFQIEPLNYPQTYDSRYKSYHLSYLINFFLQNSLTLEIERKIEKQIDQFLLYQSPSAPFHPSYIYYKGTYYFRIVLNALLDIIYQHDVDLDMPIYEDQVDNYVSQKLTDVCYESIDDMLSNHQAYNQTSQNIIQKKFPTDFQQLAPLLKYYEKCTVTVPFNQNEKRRRDIKASQRSQVLFDNLLELSHDFDKHVQKATNQIEQKMNFINQIKNYEIKLQEMTEVEHEEENEIDQFDIVDQNNEFTKNLLKRQYGDSEIYNQEEQLDIVSDSLQKRTLYENQDIDDFLREYQQQSSFYLDARPNDKINYAEAIMALIDKV